MIKIAIATNVKFYNDTLCILLPSLLNSGIQPSDITVFIAGCSEYERYLSSDIEFIKLQHNSFEYSPLIEICEKEMQSEYWFLIHDTCRVGNNFKKLLYNIPQNKPEKIALRSFPSMSIGSYRYDYLMSVKEKIFSIKNTDYSEDALNYWKQWGVPNEDFILWKTQPLPVLYNNIDDCVVLDYNNWYNSSSQRRTEYYKSLDLYKNKSNWGQSHILKRNL